MIAQFTDLNTFYISMFEFIKTLKQSGYQEWAERLEVAIQGGSTSGEILGRLKMQLAEFQSTGIPDQIGCKDYVEKAITWITKTVWPSALRVGN